MSLSYVCHGKEFRSLTSHPKLVYSMKTCSWPLCVLWYSWFIPRLNFLVSYSSEPSPGIFFICKHAGWSKDPWCENWNCQLLARCLPPKWRVKIVFRKLNCSTAIKAALVWVINGSTSDRSESVDTARLFRLFLAFRYEQHRGEGGTLGLFGCGSAAGILEPLAYTRASSSEFCYPILD